jgi:hypothetical protein
MNILVHVVLAFIGMVAVTALIVAGVETWREEHQ